VAFASRLLAPGSLAMLAAMRRAARGGECDVPSYFGSRCTTSVLPSIATAFASSARPTVASLSALLSCSAYVVKF
jgi:hypothetical protein